MISIKGDITVWNEDIREVKEVLIEGDDMELEGRFILTPSFVNAHTHLPMILLRGIVEARNFWDWLREIQEIESLMRRKEIRAGYTLGIYENILMGNTRIYSMYKKYWLVEDTLGTTLHLGPVSQEESDKDVISLLERFMKRKPSDVEPTLYAHSLYTIPKERFLEMRELRLPLQVHVSETKEEVLRVKEMYGDYPVRVLHRWGLLRDNTMLVHAGWITKGELDLISMEGGSLVHTPVSNHKLATHGFFPWKEALERSIPVYIGTDSPVTNDGQSIRDDIRFALLSARDRYWDAEPFHIDIIDRVFDDGWAVWEPLYPIRERGKHLINTFIFAPHLFRLKLLVKNGNILYPRKYPQLSHAFRVWERFRDRII